MIQYSTLLKPLYWIAMGLVYAVVVVGAKIWAEDLGLVMVWWKWLLTAGWYIVLSLTLAAGFTLIGENEPRAGTNFLVFFLPIFIVLGIGLWFLLRTF
ncbi:MAG: hypothetical protein GY866_38720 [Proteobacteria bacterium]|nr:hypothetical protein [Pseudomonadota bacterium]